MCSVGARAGNIGSCVIDGDIGIVLLRCIGQLGVGAELGAGRPYDVGEKAVSAIFIDLGCGFFAIGPFGVGWEPYPGAWRRIYFRADGPSVRV